MAKRQVFFSFQYEPDNWRASMVRNMGKVDNSSSFSDNDWETVRKKSDSAGSEHLKKVLPVLKEKLLAKGAVVNCDETLSHHTFIETCKMFVVSTLEYYK